MLNEFRKVYSPIQPGVDRSISNVIYSESLPHPALLRYVYCYWRLQSTQELFQPFAYRVVPDGCIDIILNANNENEARVMGFSTSHTIFKLGNPFHYSGVRFMPAAFPLLFGVDASTLTDRDEDLFDVIPSFARNLSEQLKGLKDHASITRAFDAILLKRLESLPSTSDKRLYNAIHIVLKSHGNIRLKTEVDTGISPRQLRRLFNFYIGDTPKMFSKIVRFQHFLKLLSSQDTPAINRVFFDAGYYDQPHFNKEFKSLFGLTPGEALT
jgi:AraC-like DNA-binding protein